MAGDEVWNTTVPAGWQAAVEGWDWHEWKKGKASLGWQKWGNCPRCQHTMSVYQMSVQVFIAGEGVRARCNCVYPHAHRPATAEGGCGVGSAFPITVTAK
jgi:hypothetical protein